MSFCPNCGSAIAQGARFCGGCGTTSGENIAPGSAPYSGAMYAPPMPASPSWKFSPLGDGPVVSWILYFAAIVTEALSQVCGWDGRGGIQFLISMLAGIAVVVGLSLAFKSMRDGGRMLSAILLLVGFSLSSLGELIQAMSWNDYGVSTYNLGVFAVFAGILTIGAGFLFLIFKPEKTSF